MTQRPSAQSAAPYTPPQAGTSPAQSRTADEFTSDEFPRIVRTRLRG